MIALIAAALTAPAAAAPAPGTATAASQAENKAMLKALLARRAKIEASHARPEAKAEALAFLDRQIAKTRRELRP
jgi:small-conductance mechanosensitive channel